MMSDDEMEQNKEAIMEMLDEEEALPPSDPDNAKWDAASSTPFTPPTKSSHMIGEHISKERWEQIFGKKDDGTPS